MSTRDDDREIRALLARYCHTYDDGRADEFAALFVDDASFTVMGRTQHGRDAIRTNIGVWDPSTPPGQHVTYNSVIRPEGDRAVADTDFCYLRRDTDGCAITTAGRYHDELVRTDEGWRFASRTIRFLGEPPAPGA